MRVKIDKEQIARVIMHVYKIYNLFFKNYKVIYNKRSLLIIETILRILSENILIKDFNLYYVI